MTKFKTEVRQPEISPVARRMQEFHQRVGLQRRADLETFKHLLAEKHQNASYLLIGRLDKVFEFVVYHCVSGKYDDYHAIESQFEKLVEVMK